jgi:glycosyltransferase involved in cell wall biosynthesis
MAIHGAEVARALGQMYDVIVLTKKGTLIQDSWQPLPDLVDPDLGGRRRNFIWPLAKTHSVIRTVIWRGRMSSTLSSLARIRPRLIYLKKFHTISADLLQMYLSSRVPVIAEFGDCHASRFARILDRVWRRSSAAEKVKLADRLTFVFGSMFLRDFYAGKFQWPVRRLVIYHGVDPSVFHPAVTPLRGNHWMFLGRTVREKGFVDFCRAIALLPRRLVDSIQIVGAGAALPEGLAVLRDSGKSDLVAFAEYQPRDAVPHRLRRATILVHPSHDDGCPPASVTEAMASGLGVVASDVGGTPEVVHDGATGLLVPHGDFQQLVRACRSLAENPSLRERLGGSARLYVVAHRNRERFTNSIREAIAQLPGPFERP